MRSWQVGLSDMMANHTLMVARAFQMLAQQVVMALPATQDEMRSHVGHSGFSARSEGSSHLKFRLATAMPPSNSLQFANRWAMRLQVSPSHCQTP
jgi:hypothetical protein